MSANVNVENKIHVATHAKQAAIAAMIVDLGAEPKPRIARVVVACVAESSDQHALPCGLCRQVIKEFGDAVPIFGVRLARNGAILGVEMTTLDELLPHAFTL